MTNTAREILMFKAKKKSAGIAFFITLFFPGAGHMYAGEMLSGFLALLFLLPITVVLYIVFFPVGFVFHLIILINSMSAAKRYNLKLVDSLSTA